MKIEKISESQIKFILTQSDLSERNIKIEDLTSPSEKTQALFRDIMEQAMEEYGFSSENTPLMVEAVPVGLDGIMIIVTKIDSTDDSENKFKLVSQTKEMRRFKKKSITNFESETKSEKNIRIFSFEKLDDVIDVAIRISHYYHGNNSLYKYQNKYFLLIQNDMTSDHLNTDDLEMILNEYGQKHISNILSKYYLLEHGEVILKTSAIKTLAKSFA